MKHSLNERRLARKATATPRGIDIDANVMRFAFPLAIIEESLRAA